MAKGITNGLPLGAIGAKAEIANAFKPGDHSSTWGPNVVSYAAANAVINVIKEENLCTKVNELRKHFIEEIEDLAKNTS